MVTMLPSVWQSVTVLALVVIVSSNVSLVSSYCCNRSGVCIADNHLDRKEREAVLKGRLECGNELYRTFRDSLDSQSRLSRNIRLSRQDQRTIESDEQNNRESENEFDKRQLKTRNHRYQQIGTLSRRLEHNQNRYSLRHVKVRNDVERKSSNVLKEEFTRLDRVREDRVRNVDDSEERLDRRNNNQQAGEKQVYELRMRENQVHDERVREEQVREEQVREQEGVRNERVREERTWEMRFLDEIKEPTREASNEHFGEERSRDSDVRDERIRNDRIVHILNREEITRRQLPYRSYNTRNNEMKGTLNVNTHSELMSDRKDNRQIRVEDSQRPLNDRRENRRTEMESENRSERRHQERLEDVVERQIRSVKDRRELEKRLSINQNIQSRDASRIIDSRRDSSLRRDISSRRDIVNNSEERANRYSDRLSAFYDDHRRGTLLKEFTHLNSPQLSSNFCQAVLIGAIILQIIKYKDGISKSKSLNAFMNYLPLMSHNHIKAL